MTDAAALTAQLEDFNDVQDEMKNGDYFVGLDIGTGSCGWAVTDKNYKVIKKSGKSLWGVRLFPTANTAADRRTARCMRRRLQRRTWRLKFLRELFEPEIAKVDPHFFQRMDESFKVGDDRTFVDTNTLFADENFKDNDYGKKYPTIYHLRHELMQEAPSDIRLLYLAVHHILKHRGHFLFENFNVSDVGGSFATMWNQVADIIAEKIVNVPVENSGDELDEDELYSENSALLEKLRSYEKDVLELLCNVSGNRMDTTKQLQSKLEEAIGKPNKDQKDQLKQCVSALMGKDIKPFVLYSAEESTEEQAKLKINFSASTYEEEFCKLSSEQQAIISALKNVYDFVRLQKILAGSKSISEAKLKIYNEHRQDLLTLKDLIKKGEGPTDTERENLYKDVFRGYANGKDNEYKIDISKHPECLYQAILKYGAGAIKKNPELKAIKKVYDKLERIATDWIKRDEEVPGSVRADIVALCKRIEDGTVFSHAVSVENSVIPRQLHEYELKVILEKAKKRYSFLNELDEYGSVCDKILKLETFRIPYYVGPVNNHCKAHSWCVKQDASLRYTPWTFDKIVDKKASAEGFIKRMTSKCTYLKYADVLPKNSILYSKFEVLQELNNIRFSGNKLSGEQIIEIFNSLYLTQKKVSVSSLKKHLSKRHGFIETEVEVVTGIDQDLKGSMSSYVTLNEFFKKNNLESSFKSEADKISVMENIILWCTLFEDTAVLKEKITEEYSYIFNEKIVNSLASLRFAGWGRMSRDFLEGVLGRKKSDDNDLPQSIINRMSDGAGNLMMLLSGEYTYADDVKKLNIEHEIKPYTHLTYDMVDELYVSPSVKRMIWQSLKVVDEIVSIMGGVQPKKIFVEMARGEEEKKRTKTRKQVLQECYKSCRKEAAELSESLDKVENSRLLSERLYLYYTQLGRCMYSGETIDVEQLYDTNIYDVDHIYPQCKVKDDSIDNKVLVKKTLNGMKSDTYPLKDVPEIAKHLSQCQKHWKLLKDKKLISDEKYKRLIRTTPFTMEEQQSFIARQLVETRQSTKEVCRLLRDLFHDTRVVYSKAGNVSEFRHKFEIIKVRELNCLHHAKDAYLNIVVGNVYDEKFCHGDLRKFFEKDGKYTYREGRSDIFSNPGQRLQKLGVWQGPGQIESIKKQNRHNDILVTELQEIRSGSFYNQNLSSKEEKLIPAHKGVDTGLYGGYKSPTTAYFAYVEYSEKKKIVRSFMAVPVYINSMKGNLEDNIQEYMKQNGYVSPRVLISQLKMPFLLRDNNTNLTYKVSGISGSSLLCGIAEPLILGDRDVAILKKVGRFVQKTKDDNTYKHCFGYDGFSYEDVDRLLSALKAKIIGTKFRRLSDSITALLEKTEFEKLTELSIKEKAQLVMNLVGIFENRDHVNDLSLIKGSSSMGRIQKSVKVMGNFDVMYPSVTGFYMKTVCLQDLK